MSVTILEALQNAEWNIRENNDAAFGFVLAKHQLHNAVTLLNKGYELETEVEPLIEKHGNVDDVPEREELTI